MSERGSFVTEYIYCKKCFEAAKEVLLGKGKYLYSTAIQHSDGSEYPIIAGKVGGTSGGEEILIFELDYLPRLEATICHPMRIAVLAESGERVFTVTPSIERC